MNDKLESKKLAIESSVRSGRLCRVKDRFLIPEMTDDDDAPPGLFTFDNLMSLLLPRSSLTLTAIEWFMLGLRYLVNVLCFEKTVCHFSFALLLSCYLY